jgi:hypothetical protein
MRSSMVVVVVVMMTPFAFTGSSIMLVSAQPRQKQSIVVFRAPPDVDFDIGSGLPASIWSELDLFLTVGQRELFIADNTTTPSNAFDTAGGNRTRSLLRGGSSSSHNEQEGVQRRLPTCPPPTMACPACIKIPNKVLPDIFCYSCPGDICRRRSRNLEEWVALGGGATNDVSTLATNPLTAFKFCQKARSRRIQADLSEVAAERGLQTFPGGPLDRDTLRVYVCQ